MSDKRRPIDTSGVHLSENTAHLVKKLGDHIRNVLKHCPPSEEQSREIALETVKAMTALGYRIETPAGSESGDGDAAGEANEFRDPLMSLEDGSSWDLRTLLELWGTRHLENRAKSPEIYQIFAERFLHLGEPLLAYDVTREGVGLWEGNVRLRQLMALALFRSKASERAIAMLDALYEEGHRDEETLGLLARAYKDLAFETTDPMERDRKLRQAYDLYKTAYEKTLGYWTGINAATLARILGDKDAATVLARKVRDQCFEDIERRKKQGKDLYWATATLAESALIGEFWDEAEKWYSEAAMLAHQRFGDLSSTRRNARLLMTAIAPDGGVRESIDRCFQMPRVVVFSGHMIDQPGRSAPRFPAELEEKIKESIRSRLRELDGRVGFASAACGSDILFLEAVLDMNGEIYVVLPFDRDQFLRESVDIIPGSNWAERYDRVLDRAKEVLTASELQMSGGGVLFDYANLLLLGLAIIRAQQLETDLIPMAVWDGRVGDGPGGTAGTIEHWRRTGLEVSLIDLGAMTGRQPEKKSASERLDTQITETVPAQVAEFDMQLKAMLFADAVGFSKLSEEQVALFVKHFLGAVSGLITAPSRYNPLTKETWGDGLYFVFANASEAGLFALDLCDMVRREDWAAKGLPPDLNFRVALHAGPVYAYTDPMTGHRAFTGMHVTRAARIEPITPPGQVYASRELAALAAVDNQAGFTCNYVGQTPLAKEYAILPLYHLQRNQTE